MKKITFYSIIFFEMLILLMNNACNKKDSVSNYNHDLPTTPVKINSLSTTITLLNFEFGALLLFQFDRITISYH